MANQVNILAIDGGGIRGIIPALLLAEIERRTHRRISKLFHLIAGTSTGGILALALAKPDPQGNPAYSADELVGLYEREGRRIFHRAFWRRLAVARNLADPKYSSEGIETVLRQYFGDVTLRQALTPVLITSYEIERRLPFFFRSTLAAARPDYDFLMRDVARATSAAPTYFEPIRIPVAGPAGYYALIDGGVYANNPAMCALAEALACMGPAEHCCLLSLGTGDLTRRIPYEQARGWGLAQWVKPLLHVLFDGVSDTVDYQVRQLLHANGSRSGRYFRFQPSLAGCHEDIDRTDEQNIRDLKLAAEEFIRSRQDEIARACEMLTG